MTDRHSLVYIGLNRWDSIWQRPHHLAQNLSQTFRVLYVDPVAYSIPGYVLARIRGDKSRNLRPMLRSINDNLTVFTPPPLLPFSLDNKFINRIDHAFLARMVRRVMYNLDIDDPILWVTFPAHLPLVGTLGEVLVCYDCMDNYPAFFSPGTARFRLATQLEERLLSCSDLVTTTASSLQKRLKTDHAQVYLVRNAVGEQFLTHQPDKQFLLNSDWPAGDGPVIGYMGTIAPWLNFEAITQLAARHPDWRIIFIGPVDIDLAPYRKLNNLYFLGAKPYDTLVNYVAGFDVGLIPFLLNELTADVNPVKLYEYFALGKPVVATALPELVSFFDVCYLANDAAEFVQQVEQAVEDSYHSDSVEQRKVEAQRRAIAQSNTWQGRSVEIINILEEHLAAKQAM